jgi:hypothetical protein
MVTKKDNTLEHNPEIKILLVDDREDNLFSIERKECTKDFVERAGL